MNHNSNITRPETQPVWETLLIVAVWAALVLGGVLLVTVWIPTRMRSRALKERLVTLTHQIDQQTADRDGNLIQADVDREKKNEAALKSRQSYWIDRRNTFTRTHEKPRMIHHQDDGRIDFKIALFTARTNLVALAENKKVNIPDDLGIEETLSTDTRVETALGQLSATVRLVKRVIDTGIKDINQVNPLPSRMKSLQDDTYDRLREYPIKIDAQADFEQCLSLLVQLGDPDNGFSLEHLTLDKISPTDPDPRIALQLVATAGRPLRRRTGDPETERLESVSPLTPADTPSRKSKRADLEPNDAQRNITNSWTQEGSQ